MNEGRQQCWRWANRAAGGALSLALAAVAVAAPPPGHGTIMPADLHSGDSSAARLGGLALHSSADRSLSSKLDLRAPADLAGPSAMAGERHALGLGTFASAPVRGSGDDSTRARLEEQLPLRPMSRAEQLATRFRREGLPVARLFESHSALVSLGLNQRGKPGIWLIQKLP